MVYRSIINERFLKIIMANTIYCPSCGAPNEENARFCVNCGANIREENPSLDKTSEEEAETVITTPNATIPPQSESNEVVPPTATINPTQSMATNNIPNTAFFAGFADFGIRFIAFIFDAIIFSIITSFIMYKWDIAS